ncbi:MAG: GNAT family N-acetyltransferase [Candidatus Hydrogenedentes bacterium]|nr:GNAT family N-acetyltransferase [Candidatus Hydrogenedentota bacterium]
MTGIAARPISPGEYPQWNKLAAGDEAGTVYHDTRWLEAVSEALGDELVLLGFYSGDRLVGGLPFQVRRRAGLTMARRAFATPYSGPLCSPGLDETTLRALTAATESAAGQYSQFSISFAPFALPPDLGREWRRSERATWLIRLEDEGTMWGSLGHTLQKKIRRTGRRGVRVADGGDPEAFYGLYAATFARRGLRPPLSRESFARMTGRLVDGGLGRVYMASADGRPCAARLVLFDRRRAYCALSGFDPAQAHLRAGDCLMWEVMRSVSAVRDQMDLVGANLSGISEYKEKFRGVLCPYVEMTRWKTTVERVLIGFHQWATRSRRGSARA